MNETDRGASSVVGVALMVGVVVVLATATSVFVFDFTGALDDPAPAVSQTTGSFVPGADTQAVKITHKGGDDVPIEDVEIIVRASGPSLAIEERLINLPAEGSRIKSNNLRNDNGLISKGYGAAGPADPNQVVIEDYPSDDNVWEAGETIRFEINVGGADFREPPEDGNPDADRLEVIVVHTPSNSILSDQTFVP